MLVLTRTLGERVYLDTADGRVCLTVVAIERGKVRLGFVAPPGVTIMRQELLPPEPPETATT